MSLTSVDPEVLSKRVEEAVQRDNVPAEKVRDRLLDCFKAAYLMKRNQGDLVLEREHPADSKTIIENYDDPELAVEEIEKRYRDLFVYLGASWDRPSRQSLGTIVELLDRAVFGIEPGEDLDGDPILAKHSRFCESLLKNVA